MFIIKKISTNEYSINLNNRQDDFIKFLGLNYETTLDDLIIYQLPDGCLKQLELNRYPVVKEEGGVVSVDFFNTMESDEVTQEITYSNLVKSCPTRLVDSMPYDAEGNYVELEEFIP